MEFIILSVAVLIANLLNYGLYMIVIERKIA